MQTAGLSKLINSGQQVIRSIHHKKIVSTTQSLAIKERQNGDNTELFFIIL
jgi:hypothetical protein